MRQRGLPRAGGHLASPGHVPLAGVEMVWDPLRGAAWPRLPWQRNWETGLPVSRPYAGPGGFARTGGADGVRLTREQVWGSPCRGWGLWQERGCWAIPTHPRRCSGHPLRSPRALSPHLEVTEVGPEADPAHVLQEHVQGVPCPARHTQRRLPVPLQRPLVLLQPQGPDPTAPVAACCPLPRSQPGAALCPQKGQVRARGLPHKGSVWLSAPHLSPGPWRSTAAGRSHRPPERWVGARGLPQPHLPQHHVAEVADAVGRSAQRGRVQHVPGQPCAVQHEAVGLQDTAERHRKAMGLDTSPAPPPRSQGRADKPWSIAHHTLTCFTASKVSGNWLWMGPEGHSTSKTSRRSAYCKERGGQPGSGRQGSAALGAGTHLPQGHPAVGVFGGGGWHRTDWQGLELKSKLSAAPEGKQGDTPRPARSPSVPLFPGRGSGAQRCPPPPAGLSTLLMTVRMANSFSVGSPASERGAS